MRILRASITTKYPCLTNSLEGLSISMRLSAASLRCLRALRVQGFLHRLPTISHKHKKKTNPFWIGIRSKATSPLYRTGVWGIGNTKGGGYHQVARLFKTIAQQWVEVRPPRRENTKKKTNPFWIGLKEAATYSPTTKCSTIGVSELNFSVRNGKRWDLTAITTLILAISAIVIRVHQH